MNEAQRSEESDFDRFVNWPKHFDGRLLCTMDKPKPKDAHLVNWVHYADVVVVDSTTRFERVRCPNCGNEWVRSRTN